MPERSGLAAIQSTHLKDVAYDSIRSALMDLRLKPGEAISENWLVSQLGISKTPIRNALTRLEQEGLVETIPFKGTFVSAVRDEDAADIFELRISLEQLAARRLAERRDELDLSGLSERARAVVRSEAAGDHVGALREIGDFHDLLVSLAGNPWLERAHQALAGPLERLRAITGAAQQSIESSTDEHLAIVEVIQRGDADEAERLVGAHLDRVLKLYLELRPTVERDAHHIDEPLPRDES